MKSTRPTRSLPGTCEICILAGGLSSRMGLDKASLRVGGRTLLGRVRSTVRRTGVPHRVIRRDLVPRCGSLGGVYTALATSCARTILFLSCDMPFVSTDLVQSLLSRSSRRNNALFLRENGRIGFPFLLSRATLAVVEQQLAARQFSLHQLARVLRARTLCLPRGRAQELFNINTPAELKIARKQWHGMRDR